MRRRDFIQGIAGSAATWPLAARAQQPERMRQIGVLMNRTADDPEGRAAFATFQQGLRQLGWSSERNAKFDVRWGINEVERDRRDAAELVALQPEVIMAGGTPGAVTLQRLTGSLPIVFVGVTDPVGAGLVETLARPGRNVTGFMLFEYSSSGKWLEFLRQIAPGLKRVGVLRDTANLSGVAQFGAIQAAAQPLGIEVTPVGVGNPSDVERAVADIGHSASGGLIVTGSATASFHHDLIIALAAKYKLPAIYPYRYIVAAGGLISYGFDLVDQYHRAAGYVDRILKGEKPADLPVQAPTTYQLVINLKTAKALALNIPQSLLSTADEVIE